LSCSNVHALSIAIIQQDGYTAEVTGPEAVRVLVATEAKPNQNNDSTLEKQFYKSFLDVSSSAYLSFHKFLNIIHLTPICYFILDTHEHKYTHKIAMHNSCLTVS